MDLRGQRQSLVICVKESLISLLVYANSAILWRPLTFGDFDFVTEVTLLSIDFDMVMQEFFKSSGIENLIGSGTRVVDDKLVLMSRLALSTSGLATSGLGTFGSCLGL